MNHWKISLDIEMIQWDDLLDRIDNLVWWIEAAPDHGKMSQFLRDLLDGSQAYQEYARSR
jgi:hypothetical protein